MDTRSISELKKLISEALETDRRERDQQMQALQEQVNELVNSQKQRTEDEVNSGDTGGSYVRGDKEKLNRQTHDIKVDIPEYDGKLDPDEFVEWLRTVERVFDYKQTTDDHKVKIVALKLRKYASTWWSNTCLKRERAGKDKIRDWSKMKAKLKQKFLPSYYVQNSFSKLHSLKQGTGTVEEYSREFEYLLMKCDVPEDDPQTLVRYLGGLESRVANVVELYSYQTLTDLTLMAHKVDVQQRLKGKSEPNRTFIKPTTFKPLINTNTNTETPKAPRRCFRCQGLGHIASECPNKRIITLADFEIANGSDFAIDSMPTATPTIEEEEELVGPDEGECLVVRRALSTTSIPEENLQRESIFHTRCTISQKVCSLIIDGGSCTNAASQTMVTKLNLSTEPHPSPYMIHWLNQGKGIRVTHRVLLQFTIGKSYSDEICCEVIPMDACHVLLGRPWQFDRKVVHDGYLNTYSFVHNHKQIVLTPIAPTSPPPKLNFTIKHKSGKLNKGADALSRKYYPTDPDFGEAYFNCQNHSAGEYHIVNGYLFKRQQLCIPRHSIRIVLIQEAHGGGLAGHLGLDKTTGISPFMTVYGVAATFNVADLQPYFDPDEPIPSLRTNFSEDGEDDRKAPVNFSEDGDPSPSVFSPIQKWVTLVQLNN